MEWSFCGLSSDDLYFPVCLVGDSDERSDPGGPLLSLTLDLPSFVMVRNLAWTSALKLP